MASKARDEAAGLYRRQPVLALVVRDRPTTGAVLKALGRDGAVFAHRGIRTVADSGDGGRCILLAGPVPAEVSGLASLPEVVATRLRAYCTASQTPLDDAHFGVAVQEVALTPENFTMTEQLTALLPEGVIVPSGFEQVGHLAHLNLSGPQLEHKQLIGDVVLRCNAPAVRTVVNKVDSISSEFRELNLELLAGDADMVGEVKQHGITFRVPFDKVYWNSRLSREHERLVETFGQGDELFDVMAGIGPFAIPAALRPGMRAVYANDLNPASIAALDENWALNRPKPDTRRGKAKEAKETAKAAHAPLRSSVKDGREFIEWARRDHIAAGPLPDGGVRHFAMNLPALAVTFLDAFRGPQWHIPDGASWDTGFLVHCYCFASHVKDAAAARVEALRQCGEVLQHPLGDDDIHDVHVVRDVAPNKLMVCVSFRLPAAIFGLERRPAVAEKRRRVE